MNEYCKAMTYSGEFKRRVNVNNTIFFYKKFGRNEMYSAVHISIFKSMCRSVLNKKINSTDFRIVIRSLIDDNVRYICITGPHAQRIIGRRPYRKIKNSAFAKKIILYFGYIINLFIISIAYGIKLDKRMTRVWKNIFGCYEYYYIFKI